MSIRAKVGSMKVAAVVMVAVALVGMSGCSLMTPTLDEAEPASYDQTISDEALVQAGTLTVAVDTTDAPQSMEVDGKTEGYAVDVASSLAQHMGLDLAIVEAPSASEALDGGEADIFIGATANDESDSISVTGDYLENATAVFAAPGESESIASADGLSNATVGVQDSSASQEALVRSGIVGSEETYSNVNECFDALAAGDVQYVACDATAGAYLARAYPGVSFAGVISPTTVYGIAVNASEHELAEAVGETLDSISADGTLDAIHAVWYGTLPMSFSDQVVSGVDVSSIADDSSKDGEQASEGEGSSSDLDSLNSLSD